MIFNKMNKTKSTLLTACLALGSVGLQAQLPEIKGAEALIRQVPADLVGARKSIDKAGTISGAEGLAYYWYVRTIVYNGMNQPKYAEEAPEAATKAVESLIKFYELGEGNTKIMRKYGYAAKDLIIGASAGGWNQAINYRNDTTENKQASYKKADLLYGKVSTLVKYDEDHDEVLKTKYPDITYNAVLLNSYQNAYFNMKDMDLSRKYLNALISNRYNDPKLYIYLARTYQVDGNGDKQLAEIKKGRAAYPNSKDLITEEINYYIQNDKLITLKTAIDKEIAGGNADANYYFIRGYINDQIGLGKIRTDGKKGDGEKDTTALRLAELDYLKAVELNPNSLDAIYNLGTLYTNFGNYWNQKAANLPYSATKLYGEFKGYEKNYFATAVKYYEQADGFSELTKQERIAMYRDMRQLYVKSKNIEKANEMKAKIAALNGGE